MKDRVEELPEWLTPLGESTVARLDLMVAESKVKHLAAKQAEIAELRKSPQGKRWEGRGGER